MAISQQFPELKAKMEIAVFGGGMIDVEANIAQPRKLLVDAAIDAGDKGKQAAYLS